MILTKQNNLEEAVKTGIITFLSIMAIALTINFLWGITHPSNTFRYKITVEILTPDGLKSGSAVHEITEWVPRKKRKTRISHRIRSRGEAVVIDLEQYGIIFAVFPYDYIFGAYPNGNGQGQSLIESRRNLLSSTFKIEAPKEKYPKLIAFDDMNNLNTGKYIYQNNDDEYYFKRLSEEKLKIRRVMIEFTDEPVTWTIEKWLPWIDDDTNVFEGLRYNKEYSKMI